MYLDEGVEVVYIHDTTVLRDWRVEGGKGERPWSDIMLQIWSRDSSLRGHLECQEYKG